MLVVVVHCQFSIPDFQFWHLLLSSETPFGQSSVAKADKRYLLLGQSCRYAGSA